eukprot:scaffold298939_cov19-Prasinocladus_malaysianus.AAC.1
MISTPQDCKECKIVSGNTVLSAVIALLPSPYMLYSQSIKDTVWCVMQQVPDSTPLTFPVLGKQRKGKEMCDLHPATVMQPYHHIEMPLMILHCLHRRFVLIHCAYTSSGGNCLGTWSSYI